MSFENDGIFVVIGEWCYGVGKGCDDFVYIIVSIGIGGGIVLGGCVLCGRKGMVGYVGYMVIVFDGEVCLCGSCGCFEVYVFGIVFVR